MTYVCVVLELDLQELAGNLTQGRTTATYQFAREALTPELLLELGGPVRSSLLLEGNRVDQSGKMQILHKLLTYFSKRNTKVPIIHITL